MKRPRLRQIEVFPMDYQGRRVVCLRDPAGYTDQIAMLQPAVMHLLIHFDGRHTVEEIQKIVQEQTGQEVTHEQIESVVESLDEALFLESSRFLAELKRVNGEFLASPARPAYHAGRSYPADRKELVEMLSNFFTAEGGPGVAGERTREAPRAMVVPHIDFPRGGPAYAHAYRCLAECRDPPELFVVLGTNHQATQGVYALTRKDYETPLGRAVTDVAVVDAVAEEAGGDRLFSDEVHHRGEHAIEFQAVWLRHVLPDHELKIVPVLCGSMEAAGVDQPDSHEELQRFLSSLKKATKDRRVCFIAGADLAHVGPRFGDAKRWADEDRAALEKADRLSMEAALKGDAAGFFDSVREERSARRVCGTSSIYSTLRLSGSASGRLLAYAQCPADDDGGSLVSIASAVFE